MQFCDAGNGVIYGATIIWCFSSSIRRAMHCRRGNRPDWYKDFHSICIGILNKIVDVFIAPVRVDRSKLLMISQREIVSTNLTSNSSECALEELIHTCEDFEMILFVLDVQISKLCGLKISYEVNQYNIDSAILCSKIYYLGAFDVRKIFYI